MKVLSMEGYVLPIGQMGEPSGRNHPKLFGEIKAAAVTLEPVGGLPKPSDEMDLRGSL